MSDIKVGTVVERAPVSTAAASFPTPREQIDWNKSSVVVVPPVPDTTRKPSFWERLKVWVK